MDKIGLDSFDYAGISLQNFFKLKDVFSENDNEENEPDLGFRNTLNKELINAARHLESTGKIGRAEASALMSQALTLKDPTIPTMPTTALATRNNHSNEASALNAAIGKALNSGKVPGDGSLPFDATSWGFGTSTSDIDSLIRFDFAKQVNGVIELTRERVAKSANDKTVEQLGLALEKILTLRSFNQ